VTLCERGILWRSSFQLLYYYSCFQQLSTIQCLIYYNGCSTLCSAASQSSWCRPGHKSLLRRTFTQTMQQLVLVPFLDHKSKILYLEIEKSCIIVHNPHSPHTPHMALAIHCQKERNWLLGGYQKGHKPF
jgi:hypothetical protein